MKQNSDFRKTFGLICSVVSISLLAVGCGGGPTPPVDDFNLQNLRKPPENNYRELTPEEYFFQEVRSKSTQDGEGVLIYEANANSTLEFGLQIVLKIIAPGDCILSYTEIYGKEFFPEGDFPGVEARRKFHLNCQLKGNDLLLEDLATVSGSKSTKPSIVVHEDLLSEGVRDRKFPLSYQVQVISQN